MPCGFSTINKSAGPLATSSVNDLRSALFGKDHFQVSHLVLVLCSS